ncbi:DNA-dependent RNA polymerase subunit epsilon [Sporosarcina gallistercoris]|uniref:DNA-directed RNA polymerase subunit epsilon n=1 Tax=Sporosarcina gallistercoris TaxID=2762245 RepID=A0ABR8PGQ1_9BACL|nr:DNA-directed RNA polymerase subunit epsilon [Sporosarcina gallistercoris]MBD7907269.1 DNA-dependent RNA polymerase auxiliary subunit epsilon family protein [Sporosarcina gallistercoris]
MIFKVYYQETKVQVPVRENTKTMYVEAETQREVRKKLQDRNYNIEFIQQLEGEHLEYEKASEHFELEQV